MAWKFEAHGYLFLWLVLSMHIVFCSTVVYGKSSHLPISDAEIRSKKDDCYVDIESGLWGRECKFSIIAKENCALKCLSPRCYEIIYESDPLEEGEKDLVRSQEYKFCLYKESMGESLERIRGSFE
ncbi:uncharacterized protein LOC141585930 [Silene latifolia]|uniref:uncharacterized protein LOC141585930 n=1 Tax=Silene latifolia TaxID=37657 RepID=UPI003D76EA7D